MSRSSLGDNTGLSRVIPVGAVNVVESRGEFTSSGGVMVSCDDDEAPRKSSESNSINDSVSDRIHNMAEKK